MTAAGLSVAQALRDPHRTERLTEAGWAALITAARAESLLAALAHRLDGLLLPERVAALLDDARREAEQSRVQALWEAEMARRALSSIGTRVVLLKGTAYAAGGLAASQGRTIGDLDILVARDRLDAVQAALLDSGWEWVKEDAYDDLYYRRWMHELPPLIHKERDRIIDVHHTILPLTARRRPDPEALLSAAEPLPGGLHVLAPADMVVHAATHLFADGDLAGGLRNLWDIARLVDEFRHRPGFWSTLQQRADLHQMTGPVARSLRLAKSLFGTHVDEIIAGSPSPLDALFCHRLLARNGWGQPTRRPLRLAFYVRSHWLRMPPLMLARHLWIKANR